MAVDIFFAGTLKDVGKVYVQTVLDCLPSSRNISGSRDGRPGTRPSRRCRRIWTRILRPTTGAGSTAAAAWKGGTPYAVFKAGIPRKRTRQSSARKEVKKAA